MANIHTVIPPHELNGQYKVTKCKDCKFKITDDEGVQVGCQVKKMTDYFQVGPDREIKRYCHFKRTDDWQGSLGDMLDEVSMKYNGIVEWTNEEDVKKTLDSLAAQFLKPQKLIVVCYQKNGESAFNLLKNYNIKWTVTEVVNDLTDWRDDVIMKNPTQFYTFIKTGYTLDEDYFFDLNHNIHMNDLRFHAIQSDNLLIVPHGLYTMVIRPLRVILEEASNILNENFIPKEK